MNPIAHSISETPTLEEIQSVTITIPHLTKVATELTDYVNNENLIWLFTGLGSFYNGQGIYNQATQWLEKCLQKCRERLGEQHHDVATSLNNLALLYSSQGKYEAAEPLYIQALELYKQLLGDNHPHVAASLNNLAMLYQSQGKYEAAEPLYQQALELRKQLLGDNHPDVADSLNNLALLYHSQGKYEAAEPLYLQAIAIAEAVLGKEHPNTQKIKENFNYYLINKYLAMPEAEMRQILAEEVCEQLLQYKKTMSNEQWAVISH